MNAHTAKNRTWRFAQATAVTAALIGIGACDSVPDPVDLQNPTAERTQAYSAVTPPFAGIGDQVVVTIAFESYPADAFEQQAHVSWDPASFEYIQTLPPGSSPDIARASGSTMFEADVTASAPKSKVILLFRALVNTSTSGIRVYPHPSPPLP